MIHQHVTFTLSCNACGRGYAGISESRYRLIQEAIKFDNWMINGNDAWCNRPECQRAAEIC